MKILYHHRIRSKDGQFVHIEELVGALRGLGHKVLVVGPPAVEREAFGADGGSARLLKRWLPGAIYELLEFGYNAIAFWRLLAAYWRFRPDGLYERYNLFLVAGTWLKALTGLPMLVEVNAPLSEERALYGGLALERLARWSERYVWRRADRVLPVTRVLAGWPQQAGVPPERIVVVPNGIDPARFAAAPTIESAKRALGLDGKLVLGFTGFIRDWHGLDRIIDYLADMHGDHDLHFLVVGDGAEAAKLIESAQARDVADRITLAGLVARDRIPDFVAAFDIALQPAVTAYASPLKILEYMAIGRAIVAPDCPNIRELLTNGTNAILFDPDDPAAMAKAIDRLVQDPRARARIGQAARDAIVDRNLTWRHNAETVVRLLRRPAVGLFCLIALAAPFTSASGAEVSRDPIVFCHDRARQVVIETLASDCHGEVVSREQAAEIGAERVRRVQRALQAPRAPAPRMTGPRLAGIGSGFFVAEGGRVLTSRHVVEACAALVVETPDGRHAPARIVASSAIPDLALLETDLTPGAIAVLGLQAVIASDQRIVVVGYPDQGLPTIRLVLTAGLLMPGRIADGNGAHIVLKANIRRGNSGGPVFDETGLVVGLVTATVDTAKTYRESGELLRGIGIAIPATTIRRFLAENGVAYRATARAPLSNTDGMADLARAIVVRVACWQ